MVWGGWVRGNSSCKATRQHRKHTTNAQTQHQRPQWYKYLDYAVLSAARFTKQTQVFVHSERLDLNVCIKVIAFCGFHWKMNKNHAIKSVNQPAPMPPVQRQPTCSCAPCTASTNLPLCPLCPLFNTGHKHVSISESIRQSLCDRGSSWLIRSTIALVQ